ncbi:carboxypeptidase regulatory-like domain-containing protein [Sphingobacterium thalpophilum]|uniref:TonB-dependent receptor n=1 Tax=Sphingobacterium thalpophilum TaxID=259 RepID=UPI0037DA0328
MKRSLLFFALVMASYGAVQAQVTTSSVTGIVKESNGSLTSGATIKATHVPSGTVYSGSSNAAGRFNLPAMRVGGPYRIEVTYVGQQPIVYEDVYLQLGEPFVLNPVFADNSTTLGEVVVTGYGNKLTTAKTGAATNVGLKQIQNLPQISRSITEFTRLTPQANGTSFAGRDSRYNNLQIDGANFNNGFGTDTQNPLPGGRFQPISLDAIQEISVNIAPYDVTQSGFTGAGINAVTKSGSNTFTGSVYGYFNNQRFNGLKIADADPLPYQEGSKRTFGFSLGGPIIKNKLFFYVSAEREMADGVNASGANTWVSNKKNDGKSDPSTNTTRVSESDLIAVSEHLKNVWGYDPGAYEGYANTASQKGDKILARIDWNINEKHKFAIRYNQLVGNSNQIANNTSGPGPRSSYFRVSENSMVFQNGNYGFENTVRSLTAELNSNFSSALSNKFLFTYSKIREKRTTPSDHIFPFVDIFDGGIADGKNNYISFGTELFSYNNDVVNDNFSFVNNLNYSLGKHNILAGASFELQKFGNSFVREGTSYYRYNSVEDFLKTGTQQEVAPTMFALSYPYAGMDSYARTNYGLASLYAQDKVTITDRFNVTIGLRAELPIYINKLAGNKSIDALEFLDIDGNVTRYNSAKWPKSRIMLSPRIGFNYDALGDRSLMVRGGTGIFTGRIPFVWLTNMPSATGVIQNTVEPGGYDDVKGWIGNVKFHPEDIYYYVKNPPKGAENIFIQSPNEGVPGSIAMVDPDFKMPSIWRTSLGADYKIPNTPITLTADLLYTKDVNAVTQFGINRKVATSKLNNAGDNRDYYATSKDYQYNSAIGANSAVVLTNTKAKGHALSATFGGTVAPWHGLSGSLFYTYTEAKEQSNNPGSSAVSAWSSVYSINNPNDQLLYNSNFAVPHRIVASLNYSFQNTTIGLYYNGSSQGRYSFVYNGDVNNDGINSDLIYLPKSVDEVNFVNAVDRSGKVLFTVDQQKEAYSKFIEKNGLSKYQGKYLDRNQFLLPWLNRIDVRWTQNIFNDIVKKGDKFQFTVDVINLGNLINKDWGVQKTLVSQGTNFLSVVDKSTDKPTFNMNSSGGKLVEDVTRNVSNVSTTWSAVLGVRYSF